jgi:hypothetical protein
MTKAPLGEQQVGKNPTDQGKLGTKRSVLTEGGACQSTSPWKGRIAMNLRWRGSPSSVSPSHGRSRPQTNRRGCIGTRVMMMTRWGHS